VAVAVPAFAATPVNVPKKFKKFIPKAKKKTGLPVRLPQRVYPGIKSYAAAHITRKSWVFELSAARHCNFATACYLAGFYGERNGKPDFKRKVKLAHGITGYFHRVTCGASCAPAVIQWKEGDVLFGIENKNPGKHERRNMIKLANSAIRHGDR
jgi:hypothetical protein